MSRTPSLPRLAAAITIAETVAALVGPIAILTAEHFRENESGVGTFEAEEIFVWIIAALVVGLPVVITVGATTFLFHRAAPEPPGPIRAIVTGATLPVLGFLAWRSWSPLHIGYLDALEGIDAWLVLSALSTTGIGAALAFWCVAYGSAYYSGRRRTEAPPNPSLQRTRFARR